MLYLPPPLPTKTIDVRPLAPPGKRLFQRKLFTARQYATPVVLCAGSTLQILHDMRILTKMDSPAAPPSSSSASGGVTTTTALSRRSADNNNSTEEGAPPSSLPGEDPFAYRHATAQVVPISTDETTGKAVAVGGGGDGSAAIDKFHKVVEAKSRNGGCFVGSLSLFL